MKQEMDWREYFSNKPCDNGWSLFVSLSEQGKTYEEMIRIIEDMGEVLLLEWAHNYAIDTEMIAALDKADIGYYEPDYYEEDDYEGDFGYE